MYKSNMDYISQPLLQETETLQVGSGPGEQSRR